MPRVAQSRCSSNEPSSRPRQSRRVTSWSLSLVLQEPDSMHTEWWINNKLLERIVTAWISGLHRPRRAARAAKGGHPPEKVGQQHVGGRRCPGAQNGAPHTLQDRGQQGRAALLPPGMPRAPSSGAAGPQLNAAATVRSGPIYAFLRVVEM